jgi:asparagine synthase (glutamine-hydrolysing)
MCGIAGFTQFKSSPGNKQTLLEMGNAIAHRGPDANGEFLDNEVGLCHRRLSIIDLSSAGNQPMFSHDEKLVIVFNGEIYNFQELRSELQAKGHIFNTKTDTEVILALYQYEGTNLLSKLNGMFAFALWDKAKKTLFIARDRIGKKPLYYYDDGKHFLFASEIKALLKSSVVRKEIRLDALYDFFTYQYVPDPKTIFKNMYKLEPGHWMTINADGIKKEKYWDVSFKNISTKTEQQLTDQLFDMTQDCVNRRMVSDVPLGAFLSGGIDSSGVVGMMANNSSKPVTTCSIGFDSKKFDEVEYASIVAKKFKTDHHEFTVSKNVESSLEHIVSFFDEPFADQSLVPTYFVSELARQKVTVALAGDGGDEVFAGYEKYAVDYMENKLRGYFPSTIRSHFFPPLAKFLAMGNSAIFQRGSNLLNSLSADPGYGFFISNSFFSDTLWNSVINDKTKQALSGYHPSSITTQHYDNADTDNHLSKIMYADMKTYLPGDILVKVDRMSMANSLEVRAPLLDYELIEFAAKIPASLKFNGHEKKHILKESFKKILPDEILYRKKMGFSVPLAHWLRHEIKELAEKRLFDASSGISDYFNIDVIKKIWDLHQTHKHDYSTQLWSFLMFQMWWDRYMLSDIKSNLKE